MFQRNASNSNNNAPERERADTEDTVDLADEGIDFTLASNPEQEEQQAASNGTHQNGGAPADAGITSPGAESAFSIDDAHDGANEDDFVGSPAAPKPPSDGVNDFDFAPVGSGEGREQSSGDDGEAPAAPEATTPPSSPRQRQEPQRVNLQSRSTTAAMQNMELNAFHAVMVVIAACAFLFVLFFFNFYK